MATLKADYWETNVDRVPSWSGWENPDPHLDLRTMSVARQQVFRQLIVAREQIKRDIESSLSRDGVILN